jgi:hypothetical protein
MGALAIVIDALKSDAGVGTIVGDRIFAVVARQSSARPSIVATLLAENDAQLLAGAARYADARVEVQCIAASATDADRLGEAVKEALEDITKRTFFDNASPPAPWAAADITKEGADLIDASDDRSIFRRVMDFSVRWRRI